MSRGLHILGYDDKRMASAVLSSLAEGFAQGATRQRADGGATAPLPPPPPPVEESNTVWYVASGAAILAVVIALLLRSRG